MKKFYLLLVGLCLSLTNSFAAGTLTCNPDPIPGANGEFTLTLTGSNLTEDLYLHIWVLSSTGSSIAGTDWNTPDKTGTKMTLNANGDHTITLNLKSYFDLSDEQAGQVAKAGFIVRKVADNSDAGKVTGDVMVGVGAPLVASDRFKISYGIEGEGNSWGEMYFVQDENDKDIFTLDMDVPADYEEYSYWIGYNEGGIGDPFFIAGQSQTELMSRISGIKAGNCKLVLKKSSGEDNWGVKVDTSVGVSSETPDAVSCLVQGNELNIECGGLFEVSVYTAAGQLLKHVSAENFYRCTLNAGLYLVRVNNYSYKIIVK